MSITCVCASLKAHSSRVETGFLFNGGQQMQKREKLMPYPLLKAAPSLSKAAQILPPLIVR